MSSSLFLDPFQEPAEAAGSHVADLAVAATSRARDAQGGNEQAGTTDVVPGEVLDSAAAADRTERSLAVAVPLDLVDMVAAFLEDTHLWWPRDLKATDRDAHVFFAEGLLYEEGSEGELHRWGSVLEASDDGLVLDWLGLEPSRHTAAGRPAHTPGATGGAAAVPGGRQGTRVFLSWRMGAGSGSVLEARASSAGRWPEDFTALWGGFARFTGGQLLEAPDVAGPGHY